MGAAQRPQGTALAVEGSTEPPRSVAIDAASMRWLSGRRVGYAPSLRRDDDGTERVRLDAVFVSETRADERDAELRAQLERAAAAGRPRLSLASEVISLPFDEFIERYLAEPGRDSACPVRSFDVDETNAFSGM